MVKPPQCPDLGIVQPAWDCMKGEEEKNSKNKYEKFSKILGPKQETKVLMPDKDFIVV